MIKSRFTGDWILVKKHLQGGAGSGNFGHAGRPGEVGGSAPAEGSGFVLETSNRNPRKIDLGKQERAKRNVKIVDAAKWKEANHSEKIVAEIVGGVTTPPGHPVDVLTQRWAIETKTIFPGAHEKMTMHGLDKKTGHNSLQAKKDFAKKAGLKGASVMRVLATGKMYFKEGFGSFRSTNMTEVTPEQLAGLIR
jgi:hypothetical protein